MQSIQSTQFLLCDITKALDGASTDWNCVSSPIQCLNRAVEENHNCIVIVFVNISIQNREILLELCATLKRNKYTKDATVIALLDSKHRQLIDSLQSAGVDYIKYACKTELDIYLILKQIEKLYPDDRPGEQIKTLCPFLHYTQIDPRREMCLCGAYFNRLVLGELRLRTLCENVNHSNCEYFLKPRIKA